MVTTVSNKPESIDWSNMDFPINDYCTVGELLKNDCLRIPSHQDVKENLISLATSLKFLKMRSQIPFIVTMGYMPSSMARFRGYANEYCYEDDILTVGFCRLLCYMDDHLGTNLYEHFGRNNEKWTRRNPITQGRYLSVVPTNDQGVVVHDPDLVLQLLAECEKYWNGKVVLSEHKTWIGLTIWRREKDGFKKIF